MEESSDGGTKATSNNHRINDLPDRPINNYGVTKDWTELPTELLHLYFPDIKFTNNHGKEFGSS